MLLQRAVRVGMTGLISGRRGRTSALAKRLAFGLAALTVCAPAWAGPEGERVVAGQAGFRRFGPQTTITASNGAIINYHSFNIGPMESVRFIQPSADSRVLNRIDGPDPSVIAGRLDANGIVYIMNPSGVYFRQGALVNVGQIYAGAARLSDADFLAGRNHFTDVSGSVVNEGVINAPRGAALVGQVVSNAGVINASGGVVAMASGDDVLVGEAGGNVYVRVSNRAEPGTGGSGAAPAAGGGRALGGGRGQAGAEGARVSNTGTINNDRGRTTMVAGDVYGMAIFGGGRIKSREVNIEGQGRGAVQVAGEIDARGSASGERGGRVTVTGEHVRLTGASVDASGQAGGGEVLVGGDFQGSGEMRRASTTLVDGGSTIRADGLGAGTRGGTAVVWSDGTTGVYGAASVQGGVGGAGGLIETSGKETLDIRGARVRAGSVDGAAGTWLLDPSNVSIQDAASSGGSVDPVTGAYTISADSAVINAADITDALEAGANVTIHTNNPGGTETGNITVGGSTAATINPVLGAGINVTLTLQAANDITLSSNAAITPTGAGSLGLVLSARDAAGGTLGATGLVTISTALNIGSLSVSGRTIALDGGSITTAGNQSYVYSTVTATQGLTLNAATTLTSTGGDITLGTAGAIGTLRGTNTLSITANAGTITFNTTVGNGSSQPTSLTTSANAISITGGFLRTNGPQSHTGAVTINTPGNSFSFFGSNITFNSTLRSAVQGEESLVISSTGLTTFAAAVGGASGDFASLFVSGTGGTIELSGGSVQTTGNQVYVNATTLGADTTLTVGSGANVQFLAALSGTAAGQQSLTIAGNAEFAANVGATTLEFLDVSGTASISGDIATAGAQDFGGNVTLAGSAGTRTLTGSTITFDGTVNGTSAGQQGLAITGNGSFAQAVGGGTSLASLSVSGATTLSGGAVTTTGTQSYTGAVSLGADTTLDAGTGNVTFGGTVDAADATDRALTVNSTGTTTFGGAVGSTFDLSTLTTNAGGTTALNGGAITTSGAIVFNDAVALGADTTINAGTGNVTFASTVDAADATDRALTVNSTGTTTFGGAVGSTFDLSTLTTNAGGTTALNGGAITTSGAVAFNDAVALGADTTINAGTGNVTFASTVDAADATDRALTVNSTGTTTFGGAVGSTFDLSTLTTDAGGTTALNGGAITTSGAIAFNDAVALGADTTINAGTGNVTFAGTIDAADATDRALTVNSTGTTTFGGAIGSTFDLSTLTTNAGGTTALNGGGITTTGAVAFNDAVSLGVSTTINAGTGSVTFGSTIDSTSTARALTVNTTGATRFDASIGATTALSTLTTNAGGTVQIGNATGGGAGTITIRTSGAGGVNFGDAISLDADTTITTTSIAGNAVFGSTIDALNATARSLTVNVTGLTRFGGNIGATNALSTLATGNGGSTVLGNGAAGISIATTGNQTYADAVTLGSTDDTTITLSSTGGTVAFSSTVEASGTGEQSLSITGNASFASGVGATTALGAIGVSGSTSLPGATIATSSAGGASGNQTYTGGATLAGANGSTTTLAATGGTVTIGGTLSGTTAGQQALSINGNAAFNATTTGTALSSIGVSGSTALNGASLAATNSAGGSGNISLTGAVTLGGGNDTSSTLASTGGTVTLGSTVDATTAGEQGLLITGNASLADDLGAGTALREFSVSGTTAFTGSADAVATSSAGGGTGNQSYTGAVTLNNGNGTTTTLTSTGGAVNFGNAIDGAAAGQQGLAIAGNAAFGGSQAIGGTQALRSLSVSGTSQIGSTSVNTTNSAGGSGDQSYTGAVTLTIASGGTTTLSTTGGTVTLGSTVDASAAGEQGLAISGPASLNGVIGGGTALRSFAVSGTTAFNAGASAVTTTNSAGGTGDQTYSGDVTFNTGNDTTVTLTSTGGTVGFSGNIAGAAAGEQALSIVGNASFGNTSVTTALASVGVSGSTALGVTSLTATSAGGGTGNITLTGPVTLAGGAGSFATLSSTGGVVGFGSTLDATTAGEQGLTINGAASFGGNVGSTAALRELSVTGASSIGGNVTTSNAAGGSGDQTFTGAVTLAGGNDASLTLTSTGGTITFGSTIDATTAGEQSLSTAGNVSFGGAVGGTAALGALSASGGTIALPATVTTTNAGGASGNQTYGSAATLTADTTLTSTGGTVAFQSTLNGTAAGQEDLTVTGNASFGGAVGGTTALGALAVSGTSALSGGAVTTQGTQTYTGAATLAADTTLDAGAADITFGSTVNSADATARNLTVNSTGTTTFGGDVGTTFALGTLSTNAGGQTTINAATITTSGDQTFGDSVVLGTDVTLNAANVTFTGTLDGTAANQQGLTITTPMGGGLVTFGAAVGGTTPLEFLTINGVLVLTADTTFVLDSFTAANIRSTGGTWDLTLTAAIDATIGNTSNLDNSAAIDVLTSNGAGTTTLLAGSTIRTTGAQSYSSTGGTLIGGTAGQNAELISGGTVTFGGTIDSAAGGARGLVVTTGADTTFSGSIGGTQSLSRLQTNGGGTTNLGAGTINASGASIVFDDAVVLTADTTITDTGSGVFFNSTVDSDGTARDLSVTATTGAVTFGQSVGATSALDVLTVSASTAATFGSGNAGAFSVNTAGNIGITGPVILLSDMTFASTAGTATFNNTIDSFDTTAHSLAINTPGLTTLRGDVGSTNALSTLSTSGGGSTQLGDLAGGGSATLNINTTGATALNISDALLLGSNLVVDAAAGAVTFGSTVDSVAATPFALSVNSTGLTTFVSDIGGTSVLDTLSVLGGPVTFGNGTAGVLVTTANAQSYSGAVTVNAGAGNAVTFTAAAGGVSFSQTLDAFAAGVDAVVITNAATFTGDVGGTAALASLGVGGAASIGGNVTTSNAGGGSGDQTYSGAVTLAGANDSTRTLTSTGGLVSFGTTIDATTAGEQGLSVAGNAAFNGAVGGTAALRDLAVSGTTAVNTTAITTSESGGGTGNQTYTGVVTFGTGNDSTITFTSGTGTVAFGAAVDGAAAGEQSIVVSGNASFGGDIGATTALGAVNVTGTTALSGASVSTTNAGGATGSQTYGGNVTLNTGDDSTATFNSTGGSVNFNGGLSGTSAGEQSVVVNGDASIAGSTTVALGAITVTGNTTLGNGNIDTTNAGGATGSQNYASVTLTGAPGSTTTLNATGGNITLGTVEAQADNGQNLAVNATGGGQTLFNGTVGATNALASLLVSGGASINTTSIRTTNAGGGTGNQTFTGAITFGTGNDSTITFDSTGGTVSFSGALDGQAAGEQAIVITGNASFGGAIGATTALASISVGGSTTINGSSVVTTNAGGGSGNQTYTGAVTFTSGMGTTFTFNTTGGSVNFGSTLDGSGAGFESVVVTGNTTFGGIVGGTNALASLSVSGIANLNTTAITTTSAGGGTGNQTYSGAVVLGAANDTTTTLTATGGTVAFATTVDAAAAGEQSLSVAGNATFGGNVGGTTALGALSVSGTSGIGAVTITTSNVGGATGNQTYTGAATLTGGNDTTATLASTGGLVTFGAALEATAAGEQGLAITGNASLQNVGATTALRSLAVSGTSSLAGTTYRTTNAGGGTGNQTYTGATTLASASGASVTFTGAGGTTAFGSTLDASAPGAQTVTVNGNASFGGAVGGTNRLFRLNVAGAASVGNDISTTLGQLFTGDVTLTRAGGDNNGLSTFDGGDGPMTFLGNINATASGQQGLAVRTTGTMRFESGAASPNVFPTADGQIALFRAYQPPVGFGGSIGATTPLRSIEITTQRATTPTVSTIVFAPGLSSENRVPDTTPSATIDATTFTLRATDTITFGFMDKVLAFGSLTLNGAGGNTLDSARIGDITALRAISITADQIAIRRRAGGFILGQTDGTPSNTVINNDRGVDFLGTAITFSVEPFVHDGLITAPTQIPTDTVQSNRIIAFATPDGSGVTVPSYATVQAFGDISAQFTDRGPAPAPGFFLPFDLRSEGPVNTSISNTLAAFVVVEPPDIEQSTSLGSALRDELREIAILTRDLDPSEFVEFLVGRALFDDRFESAPATSSLSAGGTGRTGVGVAVARLAADVVRKVLTNFKEIKADQDAYRDGIAAAYEAFIQTEAGQTEEFDPRAFHAFVSSDAGSTVARTAFDKLAVIFRDIDQLGLGPVETVVCKRKIVGFVRPSEMTDDELVKAIETPRLTASAAK